MTVQDHDRRRPCERAEIFNRVTDLRTRSFVTGQGQEEPGPQAPDGLFLQYRQ